MQSESAFFSEIDGVGAVVLSSSVSAYVFPNISDGQSLFGSLYLGPEFKGYTLSVSGTDASLIRTEHILGNSEFVVSLKNTAADHRVKTSYAFNLVATSDATVKTLSVTCDVAATILPNVSDAVITVGNGLKGVLHTFSADEPCAFDFDIEGTSDNSQFTLSGTNNTVLSLINRSSFNTKSSYTVNVRATSLYNTLLQSPSKTFTINVTNQSPLFLETSGGIVQSGNYLFTVADGTTTILGANSDNKIHSSDDCIYTLSGADAASFSVMPTTGEENGKFATLSLLNAARKQDQLSYSFIVTANNGTHTATSAITVTVGSDTILPILTGSSANSTTYAVATGVNSEVNPDIVAFNAPLTKSIDIFDILADENVTFTLDGLNSSLFKLGTVANVATNASRPNSRKVGVSFINDVLTNTKINYDIQIKATDAAENVTSKYVKVMISDVTKPIITLTSATGFVINDDKKYTNSTVVLANFTTSEPLSSSFSSNNFEVIGGSTTFTAFNLTTTSASISVKVDSTFEDQDITLKLKSGTVKDGHNNLLNDEISLTFRYKRILTSVYEMKLVGDSSIVIPQGRFYTDVGFVWNGLSGQVLESQSTVDVTKPGTYAVTHKATVQDSLYTATRSVTVSATHAESRVKPTIVVTGGTRTFPQILPKTNDGVFTDDATVAVMTNSVGGQIPVTVTNGVDTSRAYDFYTVTYIAGDDDVYGSIDTANRSVSVTHPVQVITLKPKSGFTAIKTVFEPDEAFVNTAEANKIYNKNGEEIPVTETLTINTVKFPQSATVTFNARDDVFALAQVTLNLTVRQQENNVDFTLSGIKPTFTFSTVLNLNTATGPAPEDDLTIFPGVKILKPISDYNSMFYIKPNSDLTIELQPNEVFTEYQMDYKINPDAFNGFSNLNTLEVTENIVDRSYSGNPLVLTGNVANSSDSNQIISKVVIANAIQDMFKTSRLESVISSSSKNSMTNEITTILTTTLNAEIKKSFSDNSSKTNDDKAKTNFARQLIGQLHRKIINTAKEYRLTTSETGMFHSSKKILSGDYANYYPFEFEAGDTLTFSVKFTHPTAEAYQPLTVAQPKDTEISIKLVFFE